MFNAQIAIGNPDDFSDEIVDRHSFAIATIENLERRFLLLNNAVDEINEIIDIKQISRLFAGAPDDHPSICRGQRFRNCRTEYMRMLEIEFIMGTIDIRMTDDCVASSALSRIKLAHLFEIELSPGCSKILWMDLVVCVKIDLGERLVARLIHYRTAKENDTL